MLPKDRAMDVHKTEWAISSLRFLTAYLDIDSKLPTELFIDVTEPNSRGKGELIEELEDAS